MEVVHRCCAGLDVHKAMVMACVRTITQGKISYESRSFETTTKGLLELGDWLEKAGCTHVAMEATGVFWKPVWHLLEDRELELVLANARHIKNVPGRKTDKKDAEWISDLLAHGLIQGSFVPPRHIQEVRDLTRSRKQLVREKARHTQRIQKTLEDANLKLTSVMKDVLGVSGRRILDAIVGGETDAERLADKALLRRMKRSRTEIVEACRGRVTAHHRFLIEMHLKQIDGLDTAIRKIEDRAGEVVGPFDWAEESP